jgi:hypothetical protein
VSGRAQQIDAEYGETRCSSAATAQEGEIEHRMQQNNTRLPLSILWWRLSNHGIVRERGRRRL